jgi:hypothetical protein
VERGTNEEAEEDRKWITEKVRKVKLKKNNKDEWKQ